MIQACIAVFADPEVAHQAYRSYWQSKVSKGQFLGFRLPPSGRRPHHSCCYHQQYLVFRVGKTVDFPLFEEKVKDMLLVPLTVKHAVRTLESPDGWLKLKALAYSKKKPGVQTPGRKSQGRLRYYEFYAEFENSETADRVREELLYLPFRQYGLPDAEDPPYVLSAGPDQNPCCVKLLVSSNSKKRIRELGREINATRITFHHQEVYRRPQPQAAPVPTA